MIRPKEIQQFPSGELGIIWEDAHESVYSYEYLRRHCPCAMCTHDPLRGLGIHPGRFRLVRIRQIGNYAVGFAWADGHDTGIYAYDYLRKRCPCGSCDRSV